MKLRHGLPASVLCVAVLVGCGGSNASGAADSGVADAADDSALDAADAALPDAEGDASDAASCEIANICGSACCGSSEACVADRCLTLGSVCNPSLPVYDADAPCADGEVCSPEHARCLPSLADSACETSPNADLAPTPKFTWGTLKVRACTSVADCQTAEACTSGFCEPTWSHVAIDANDVPASTHALGTPIVADLDADGVAEIIFNTYAASEFLTGGTLRAIHGRDGSRMWTVTDPLYETDASSTPAVGDITGDGLPEVIVASETKTLLAFDGRTGAHLWTSDPFFTTQKGGAPLIVDLDNAGLPEILFGPAIFDASGTMVAAIAGNSVGATQGLGPISCVGDLDGDQRPEIILGNAAYRSVGTVGVDFSIDRLWTAAAADGLCALADMHTTGEQPGPEVVLVADATVYILSGVDGSILASFPVPGSGGTGRGGAPVVANFDGEGGSDVVVADRSTLVVLSYTNADGLAEEWRANIADPSTGASGASAFDFDGDGRHEILYADQSYLRIYPNTEPDCAAGGPACDGVMSDDELLFIDINSSRTRLQMPVVADVDGDFRAEIVVTTNNESMHGTLGDAGLTVFEALFNNWTGARPVWNQHAFTGANVGPGLSIPSPPPPIGTTFRTAPSLPGSRFCVPDLTLAGVVVDEVACPNVTLSVEIANQGCRGVGPGLPITVRDEGGNVVANSVTARGISAGGVLRQEVRVDNPQALPWKLSLTVDESDGVGECDEGNNMLVDLVPCGP